MISCRQVSSRGAQSRGRLIKWKKSHLESGRRGGKRREKFLKSLTWIIFHTFQKSIVLMMTKNSHPSGGPEVWRVTIGLAWHIPPRLNVLLTWELTHTKGLFENRLRRFWSAFGSLFGHSGASSRNHVDMIHKQEGQVYRPMSQGKERVGCRWTSHQLVMISCRKAVCSDRESKCQNCSVSSRVVKDSGCFDRKISAQKSVILRVRASSARYKSEKKKQLRFLLPRMVTRVSKIKAKWESWSFFLSSLLDAIKLSDDDKLFQCITNGSSLVSNKFNSSSTSRSLPEEMPSIDLTPNQPKNKNGEIPDKVNQGGKANCLTSFAWRSREP